MQHYKPKSLEERGLKDVLGDQYDYFMEHVEDGNRRKMYERMGLKPSKFYRILRIYRKEKEKRNK